MDENILIVEQFLDALDNPQLTPEKGKELQQEFIKRGVDNPALQLAYLTHPRAGTDMNDPETRGAIQRLKAEVARAKGIPVDPVRGQQS